MASEFVRISVFREDYWKLSHLFGEQELSPARGILVKRALEHIDELENKPKENTK